MKTHPNFSNHLNEPMMTTIKENNIELISDHNIAEVYMYNYKYIVSTCASNAFKNFNMKYIMNYNLISLINLIEFEDKLVEEKFRQILHTVCFYNYEIIQKPKSLK